MVTTWRGKMRQRADGLWVRGVSDDIAHDIKNRRFRRGLLWGGRRKTIYDHAGNAMGQIKVSDFGNSEHEFKDHQDAVVRPDSVKVEWSAAREQMPTLTTTKDLPTIEQALREFGIARQQVETNPADQVARARYRKAKNNMVAARMQQRLNRRP